MGGWASVVSLVRTGHSRSRQAAAIHARRADAPHSGKLQAADRPTWALELQMDEKAIGLFKRRCATLTMGCRFAPMAVLDEVQVAACDMQFMNHRT